MADHVRYLTGPLGKQMRPKVIEFSHLTSRQGQQVHLQDITLEILEGESVALLGGPDSGKSILLACISGSVQPLQGALTVLGQQLPANAASIRRQIGVLPQELSFRREETIAQHLQHFAFTFDLDLNEEQIYRYCAQYALPPTTLVKQLSTLQKRIFSLARALIHDPHIALFDEPIASLDDSDLITFWPYLQRTQREGRTLICTFTPQIADRYLNEYDRVIQLEQGHLRLQQG